MSLSLHRGLRPDPPNPLLTLSPFPVESPVLSRTLKRDVSGPYLGDRRSGDKYLFESTGLFLDPDKDLVTQSDVTVPRSLSGRGPRYDLTR